MDVSFREVFGTQKSYVCNNAHPEGSIAEGYLATESLTFCSRYLKNISIKFNKPTKNDDGSVSNGEISIFKKSGQIKGGSEGIKLSHDEFKQACMYVLQNCEEISPFMERFNITGIGRGKGRGGTGRGRGHFQGRSNSGATSQPQLQLRGNTRASLETKESNNLFQEPIETGQISSYPRPSIEIVSSRNLDRSVYASPEAEIGSAGLFHQYYAKAF
ncbi:uncharacterized protein [Nicotiana sylvestris]|uniref:Uncharacterized protein isoform X2 n=2 Tax=Nicotiana TaxID=4085 RepID=A0A1S4BY72_TOBAC|nr:PREDICTED: uncharacterized protein LOC104245002 [Nicotiana sylvestris]XP_009798839.1 PREDICTED: uncharacterized protein LOC104245002 [Nicotiana sylvestris]XP_009798840.1 PREDICTED: uncharacterized protein LOC104245002 [Nicotiana sylvestris]XP_009798841.1 PREDICTED: uncharacterized protein LOC104245002 [Nicotiana sylvestris]XP_009798842.1 PREDICTED: uncharacterized protein LOC104245002 [Nicotiana sylvestris]XP_009798843.1 PREDICTED: uncharacterized protein LOC104245002 [Nicotiana sylvestris]